MQTLFSHIVQKRLSQENENVATDALAYILRSSVAARNGMMRLLQTVVPDLPDLHFRTQEHDGSSRPDMSGSDERGVRVFIENKFWAGLTDNQPVSYLHALAKQARSSLVLMIVPNDRADVVWQEAIQRLAAAGIDVQKHLVASVVSHAVSTELGPRFALTTWRNVLTALGDALADDPVAHGDLIQLRALCDAADADAFLPLSAEELTDARIPRLMLQLADVVKSSFGMAVTEGVVSIKGLRPTHGWDGFGQYIRFAGETTQCHWFGVDFALWKKYGAPLWLYTFQTDEPRVRVARDQLRASAAEGGMATANEVDEVAIRINIVPGVEIHEIQRRVVAQLAKIGQMVEASNPAPPLASQSAIPTP